MPNHCHVEIIGHLTRDCELRHTPGGTAVCDFGIAFNRRVKSGDEWIDKPVFVDAVCWGRRAEFIAQHGRKGAACHIAGDLDLDTWEDKKSGVRRQKLKVQAASVQLLGKTMKESQEPHNSSYGEEPQTTTFDDEVPF